MQGSGFSLFTGILHHPPLDMLAFRALAYKKGAYNNYFGKRKIIFLNFI
jgi:hypothetical protein